MIDYMLVVVLIGILVIIYRQMIKVDDVLDTIEHPDVLVIYEDLELKDGRIIPASEVEKNMPAHVMRRQAMIFKKTMNFEDSISNLVVEF